jgi:hypothetical protein
VVTTLCCPQDENSLSNARLKREWAIWSEIAQWVEGKVPTQHRGDIRHSIILELALARARDGDKPFSQFVKIIVAVLDVPGGFV